MTKPFADMTDDEFFIAMTGEPMPNCLKRQADLGPEVIPFDVNSKETIVVDGVEIPAWLGPVIAE